MEVLHSLILIRLIVGFVALLEWAVFFRMRILKGEKNRLETVRIIWGLATLEARSRMGI